VKKNKKENKMKKKTELGYYSITIEIPKEKLIKDGIQYEPTGETGIIENGEWGYLNGEVVNGFGCSKNVIILRPVKWEPETGEPVLAFDGDDPNPSIVIHNHSHSEYYEDISGRTWPIVKRIENESLRDDIKKCIGI
jgi:hypothetical protein